MILFIAGLTLGGMSGYCACAILCINRMQESAPRRQPDRRLSNTAIEN